MKPTAPGPAITPRPSFPGKRELGLAARVLLNFRGERRITVRRAIFQLFRRVTPVVALDRDGIRLFVSTDDEMGGWLFAFDKLLDEPHLASAVAAARRLYPSSDGDKVFVDVGANIGMTCIPAVLRHGFARAIAIEPSPSNIAFLRQNLVANGVTDRIQVIEAAAGDYDGEIEMELSPVNSGDHRVRLGPPAVRGSGEERRPTITVPVRTIDGILAREGVTPDQVGLMWMDIQGFEAYALAGATSILESPVPVVMEYWPYGLLRTGSLERLWDLANRHYRSFFDIRRAAPDGDPQPIAELARVALPHTDMFTDVLLVK